MADYRITCISRRDVDPPHDALHPTLVGIEAEQNSYHDMRTLADVLGLMAKGHTFYTIGSSGRRASVHVYDCKTCSQTTIRTDADSTQDNNLVNLPRCRF